MSKTEVREVNIEVETPNPYKFFRATIRDGELIDLDRLPSHTPSQEELKAYFQFLQEILAELNSKIVRKLDKDSIKNPR